MIPFRDNVPSRTFPWVTVLLIVANTTAFVYELMLGHGLDRFLLTYGVIPMKITRSIPAQPLSILDRTLPFLSAMFLHGGWFHLIGNMWYLWIFGDKVEDRLGHVRFFFFYLACGVAASMIHIGANPESSLPCIGASGAIAGVLGAYMITYPFAGVKTLVPLIFIWQVIELPALLVLGAWFAIQLMNGVGAIGFSSATNEGVAWWAHIGGFVVGLAFFLMIRPRVEPLRRAFLARRGR